MSKARATTYILLLLFAAAHTAAGQQTGAGTPRRFALPGKDWAFDITLPSAAAPEGSGGSTAERDAPRVVGDALEWLSGDGREYHLSLFLDFGRDGHMSDSRTLTVTLSPARVAGGAEAFRDFVLKSKSKDRRLDGVRTAEYRQIPVARYRVALEPQVTLPPAPPAAMFTGTSRVMQAFVVKDDVWLSVILSGHDYGERDEKLFHSALDSLRLTDTTAPSTSFDLYQKGRLLYLSKDYRRASEALAEALELEKRERRLDRASWRNLVINLVDSYAAARDMARAKELLDYGVAQDPANPVFHMALARYHAMRDDLDGVITSLERAYLNREKGPKAAPPPDPGIDPAFERFWKDERFRKAVKAMKKLKAGG